MMKPFLFLLTFALYTITSYPALAPYRDSGEMATVIHTLGVAHPPSYPLYIITSKFLTRLIPLGNPAKKVSVVSSIFMAGSVVFIYSILLILLKDKTKTSARLIAAALALAFGFSYLNWYLAIVQEMYTMGIFMIMLAIYLTVTQQTIPAFLVLGLATGVRTDSLLVLPAFLIATWIKDSNSKPHIPTTLSKSFLFFLVGASVFFYSYIRAKTQPLINWGNTSTLSRLLASVMRRSHGGTLDLISVGYKAGENFSDGIAHYLTHILKDYCGLPFILIPFGVTYLFKYKKNLLALTFTAWIISGLLFIYMANMPPNPHALAILEAHYLMPDVFLWLISACALVYFYKKTDGRKSQQQIITLFSVGAAIAVFYQSATFTDGGKPIGFFSKRNNYIVEDYARNIRTTAPPESAIIVKEDVQVFTLWYEKYIVGKRQDITIVASGLSGSPWYQKLNEKSGVIFSRLEHSDRNSWKNFIASNPDRKIYFTNDADLPDGGIDGAQILPCGLLNSIAINEKLSTINPYLFEFYTSRLDDERYNSYREFFTPDIIEDYTKGYHQMGFELMKQKRFKEAETYFLTALYLNTYNYPQSAFHLGWTYFSENNYQKALQYYDFATIIYSRYLNLANKYKVAEDIKNSILREAAEVWLHKGVTYERLADDENALQSYQKAYEIYPALGTAYYNTAVVYWKKRNFNLAAQYLKRTLNVEPSNIEARKYLSILESKPVVP